MSEMTKTKAAAQPSGLPSALPSALPWYMAGQAFWFLSHGIQLVAFQAIGALVLGLDATQLGLAQASLLIPALFLMLPAGVTAERNDGRIILLLLQGVAFFPPLVLGYMVLTGQLSFYGLVAYGLAMGVVGSFVMPARDALLSHIVGHDGIQRAVNMALGLQFTGMLTGMTIAALSEFIDVGWLPIIQAFIFIAASYAAFRLPRDLAQRPERAGSLPRRLPEMIDGLKMAFGHKDISPCVDFAVWHFDFLYRDVSCSAADSGARLLLRRCGRHCHFEHAVLGGHDCLDDHAAAHWSDCVGGASFGGRHFFGFGGDFSAVD